ncbi:Hypothetical predicted protein [Olea europaea subsp. europaea]|uniref:Uncharacterized protein n=1 Tax=Olea europaea subsp. europaea TaxID=158383 RepID=A0A8S0QTU2_OLEEU|nr:Hypothetical predicted protein [Olea europaea subsp. europaea]
MDQMFNIYRQPVVSNVFSFYDGLKTYMIEESTKQETRYHAILEQQELTTKGFMTIKNNFSDISKKANKTTSITCNLACNLMWIPVSTQPNLTLMNKIKVCRINYPTGNHTWKRLSALYNEIYLPVQVQLSLNPFNI